MGISLTVDAGGAYIFIDFGGVDIIIDHCGP
jgi:hypothetical protein